MRLEDPIHCVLDRKGREVWGISPRATVFEAIEAMSDKHVGALVVLDGRKLVGVVSERDYARKVILRGRSSRESLVGEIMTSPVLIATPHHTVGECMAVMTEAKVRHLPVVEEGEVVGVLSMGDLVHWMISAQEEIIHELEDYLVGRRPACALSSARRRASSGSPSRRRRASCTSRCSRARCPRPRSPASGCASGR